MTVVSPLLTFPDISWWQVVANANVILFDVEEHFQKMTSRNRYHISGSNNSIKLSVPLQSGRNQRTAMKDVVIYNKDRWQVQHWRTLVSVYKRTPYFDHYADSLLPLFETEFTHLVDFNKASVQWVKKQLKLQFEEQETTAYIKEYPQDIADLRTTVPQNNEPFPHYYQVFEDRIGFLPDLSILDLLFSEGPATIKWLRK